jgi:hypothetical protein
VTFCVFVGSSFPLLYLYFEVLLDQLSPDNNNTCRSPALFQGKNQTILLIKMSVSPFWLEFRIKPNVIIFTVGLAMVLQMLMLGGQVPKDQKTRESCQK